MVHIVEHTVQPYTIASKFKVAYETRTARKFLGFLDTPLQYYT